MIKIHCFPIKNSRFFASLRMTDYYILFVGDGIGWRLRRQPIPSPKHKTLIVISNEVRIENRRSQISHKVSATKFTGQY